MKGKVLSVLLCTALCLGQFVPTYAAAPVENVTMSSDSSVTESSYSEPESGLIDSESENEVSVVEPEVTESGETDLGTVDSDSGMTAQTVDSTESEMSVPTTGNTESEMMDTATENREYEVTVPSAESTESEIYVEEAGLEDSDSVVGNTESGMEDIDYDPEAEIIVPISKTDGSINMIPAPVIEKEVEETDPENESEELVGATSGLGVELHTQKEILNYYKKSGISLYAEPTYSKAPNTKKGSYDPGRLSNKTLKNSVGIINLIRYVAGLNYDVTIDNTYTDLAQAGTLINYLNGVIDHEPTRPAGVSKELYEKGYEGTSSSNLASGFSTIGDSILGYMSDSDDQNMYFVGHRRWVLHSGMSKTGFGQTGEFYAMYAFDHGRKGTETNIAWPAHNMPIEFFQDNDPWSISTGNDEEDISKIKVTLKRRSDNKKWTFSESNNSDGLFFVDSEIGYGDDGCIVFRPNDIIYNVDDVFDVTITGAKAGTIRYTVTFFMLFPDETIPLNKATVYLKHKNYEYTGYDLQPHPRVTYGNKTLSELCDYWRNFKNNRNLGTATIILTGNDNVRGYTTYNFNIVPRNISKGTASTKYASYPYTGKNRQPAMTLVVNSKTLVKDRDYTLTYKNNKNVGTATITAHGIGNYTGTKSCTFKIVSKQQEIIPVYRLFNTRTGEHFYTAGKAERQNYLKAGNWKSEGIAWYAPKKSSQPIYRLSNPNNGNEHHYTKSKSEKDWLVSLGWKYDCIAWYSDTNKTVPIYRHYHPTQRTGNHHYTTSKGESNHIVKNEGWKYEGVSFYVSKAGG